MTLFFVYGNIKLYDLEFAWEKVPEAVYPIVERKIVAQNKNFLKRLYIKNKEDVYIDYIDTQVASVWVPYDIRYIPYVESSLNANAISETGAVGLWQLMPETGRLFAMRIDENFDARYDYEVSTGVALEYMISLRDQFPSRTLAVAAYNRGPNWLRRDIQASQARDFYELETADETKNYIYKILAYKYGR